MRLERIAVRRFRTHRKALCLGDIKDGLTVIAGGNEEGKSTLLTALRAAFFLSANISGEARAKLTPYGTSDVPEVEVTFTRKGERYRLHKRFQRGGTTLEGRGARLMGDAAEAALEELLGFERPKRVTEPFKPEHMGLQALFWMEQGKTFEGFAPVATTSRQLAAFMENEVEAVAAGDAVPGLLARVTKRRNAYFTERRGDPTGALRDARNDVARLEAEFAELTNRRHDLDDLFENLRRKRDAHRRLIEADEIGRIRADLARLEEELAGTRTLKDALRLAESEHGAAREALDGLLRHRDRRARLRDDVARLDREARERAGSAAEHAAALDAALGTATGGAVRVEALRADHQALEARRRRLALREEVEEREARLARLNQDRAAAAAALDVRRDKRLAAEAIAVTAEALVRLRDLEGRLVRAEAALEAASTTLQVDLKGLSPTRDGIPLPPVSTLHLQMPTVIGFGAHGAIQVLPGGGDLAARREAHGRAAAVLRQALADLGAESLDEAAALARRREALLAEAEAALATARARLNAHGHAGLDAMGEAIAAEQGRLERLKAEVIPDETEIGESLAERMACCQDALARAEAAAKEAASRLNRAREEAAEAQADARAAQARADDARARLDEALAEVDDAALAVRFEAARSAMCEAEARLARAEERLRAAEPDHLVQRVEMKRRGLAQEEAERRNLERAIDALETEVRTLGGQGIDVTLAEAKGELEAARRRLDRLTLEAEAWRLLHDEIKEAEARYRAKVMAPIKARLLPYVRRLFANADPVLAEDSLHLTGLARGGEQEPFTNLSIGTREQLAVLVRLAFADLAHEHEGEAPCLILDDALVYADEDRLERMKTILEQAAKRQQILLLTCRPRDYRGLAADFRELEGCRADEGAFAD